MEISGSILHVYFTSIIRRPDKLRVIRNGLPLSLDEDGRDVLYRERVTYRIRYDLELQQPLQIGIREQQNLRGCYRVE